MLFKKKEISDEEKLSKAIEALQRGSAEAFHILYHNYAHKVYRFCLRMLGEQELAEDAFQETFIRVYENKGSFHGTNFAAWLFTIARNTCLNHIRSKKEAESFDEVFHSYDNGSNQSDPVLKQEIEKAIATLPVPMREALLLREYEDFSYQEIADTLGIELSLAKVRVHRARLQLRKLLKPLVKELNES
ncbi:MAG: sigma-70 family RNA polymerase sigma factor [Candidatus Kapaibacterium sp.]|jgi:RNA polymerase sigma-70 factor (ECF subfamily)|nr:sigma-70 family RNA polymerase sigma factor [Candidatus Kapabacteria bacterium]